MIVVADASALVAELLRRRGRELLAHPDLRVVVAEEQWDETQHELQRRIGAIVEQGRLTVDHAKRLYDEVVALIDERVIEIIPRRLYEHMEEVVRRRVPRDPHDWPPVALALALDAGILTGDHDFLGCGCPPGRLRHSGTSSDDRDPHRPYTRRRTSSVPAVARCRAAGLEALTEVGKDAGGRCDVAAVAGEHYCVVYQTLRGDVDVSMLLRRS